MKCELYKTVSQPGPHHGNVGRCSCTAASMLPCILTSSLAIEPPVCLSIPISRASTCRRRSWNCSQYRIQWKNCDSSQLSAPAACLPEGRRSCHWLLQPLLVTSYSNYWSAGARWGLSHAPCSSWARKGAAGNLCHGKRRCGPGFSWPSEPKNKASQLGNTTSSMSLMTTSMW